MNVIQSETDLVNLARYPIALRQSGDCAALSEGCRTQLEAEGVVALPDFVTPHRLSELRAEAIALLPQAFYTDIQHNCLLLPADPGYPSDHPRNRTVHNNKGGVADDLIPHDALLRQLYDWPAFRDFIGTVVGRKPLFALTDPLSSLNINVHQTGQVQGWHFDGAEFAVTLMLQCSERGGEFRYARNLRDDNAVDFRRLEKVMCGQSDEVQTLTINDGTLVIFRGHYSLHCVTAPMGERARVNAIFSYATSDSVSLNEHTRRLFYGRID